MNLPTVDALPAHVSARAFALLNNDDDQQTNTTSNTNNTNNTSTFVASSTSAPFTNETFGINSTLDMNGTGNGGGFPITSSAFAHNSTTLGVAGWIRLFQGVGLCYTGMEMATFDSGGTTMSRLGDLIKTERLRQGLSHKQVAKKCGVAESYLIDVEAGTRIIADDQARRILKSIGLKQQTEADFTLDDIAATVDLQTVQPAMQNAAAAKKEKKAEETYASADDGVAGSIWLDALTSVLKRVPVYNAVMKEVDHKLLPVLNGQIENASPDKVYYYLVPDDSLRGFRICQRDLVFIAPAASPVDGAIMLVEVKGRKMLRKVKRLENFQVVLQSYDREYSAETYAINEVNCLGRCVRAEISLP